MAKKDDILRKSIQRSFAPLSENKGKLSLTKETGIRQRTMPLTEARLIPIRQIKPDPNQPRKNISEKTLKELAQSIREHGLLQPISVEYIPKDKYFKIINGRRRWEACMIAKVKDVPSIVKNTGLDSKERLEQQLVENVQREDLSAIEEAGTYKILTEKYSYTHKQLAEKIGKPRSVISETLSLNRLPEVIKRQCRHADIAPKTVLIQVVRQPNEKAMLAFWEKVKVQHLGVTQAREERKIEKHRPAQFQYKYQPVNHKYILKIKFKKAKVSNHEIVNALQETLESVS